MVIPSKVTKYLDENKIKYEIINHRTVYTAYDKAATLKAKPSMVGKTLVLKVGKDLIMVLIPGNKNLDLTKIKKVTKAMPTARLTARQGRQATKVDFISETVMKNKFKGIKIGALPPFGPFYKVPLLVEKSLLKEKKIFINTGIHEASFSVSPKIFEKMGAVIGFFSKAR